MRAIKLKKPAGLDQFDIRDMELSQVRRGEIRVRLHASSLNFHDYYVVMGMFPTEAGRIPMSDGAGEVVETGEDVTEFAPGDRVMSTFFPRWLAGMPNAERLASVAGDNGALLARGAQKVDAAARDPTTLCTLREKRLVMPITFRILPKGKFLCLVN